MAIVSPAIALLKLAIAIGILFALNWRLALTAMAVIPGIIVISYISSKRIRPIYRSIRRDAEIIDGRVGETFSGIRVVRAFRREVSELLDYMTGRHTVLRKEMFAQRSEEHTSELQSLRHLVCRLLLEKKKKQKIEKTLEQN